MIKVALTGNIGSGKSTVARLFSIMGIQIFNADLEAKLLYKNAKVKRIIREHFGSSAFNSDQEVDFKQLAKLVFKDTASLKLLNQIIHPMVFKKYNEWLRLYLEHKYTIHEAAVIFENHLEHHYDLIINVSAPENVRMDRVMCRDRITTEQFQERAKNQWADEEKNKKADLIIINDGDQFLIPQVMKIHQHILQL